MIFTFPGNGKEVEPADNFPPRTQMLVAVMFTSSKAGSNLKVPSMYRVPKVNDARLKSMVHSQGITTSSPD